MEVVITLVELNEGLVQHEAEKASLLYLNHGGHTAISLKGK